MMKKEFEDRIGLEITADEYSGIEQAYMGMPESVNKDKLSKSGCGRVEFRTFLTNGW
jgi:hypothetical protein